jgi:hypothetical protein
VHLVPVQAGKLTIAVRLKSSQVPTHPGHLRPGMRFLWQWNSLRILVHFWYIWVYSVLCANNDIQTLPRCGS